MIDEGGVEAHALVGLVAGVAGAGVGAKGLEEGIGEVDVAVGGVSGDGAGGVGIRGQVGDSGARRRCTD